MSDQYSCEFCSNYVYDEEYEEYGCVVNMDEDDLAMLMQFKRATCPYFSCEVQPNQNFLLNQ